MKFSIDKKFDHQRMSLSTDYNVETFKQEYQVFIDKLREEQEKLREEIENITGDFGEGDTDRDRVKDWKAELRKNPYDVNLSGRFQMDQSARELSQNISRGLSKVNSEVPSSHNQLN